MVKFTTELFDIDGRKVEIARVPPRTRCFTFGRDTAEKPQEQALFEVRIDGAFVARAKRPFGKGKQAFQIERLFDSVHVSGIGDREAYGHGYLPAGERLYTLERVAAKAVELRNKVTPEVSSLPTSEELSAFLKKESELRKNEKAESKARAERKKAELAAQRVAEDAAFDDLVGGLKSIDERLGTELNNYEINALRMAIAKFEKDRETVLTHRAAFESDEFRGR
ncbi:hypothetical protein HFN89_00745 [Rhizobium laguerreae]|nr:hypothetical protein [Rhizobium laguerreae]